MIESNGEYISGIVAGKLVQQKGRNEQISIRLEIDGRIGEQKKFLLAPNLTTLDIKLRSHIEVRHQLDVIYEILSIDGKQLSQMDFTRKTEITVPTSVTIVSGLQIILGPLVVLNAITNRPYAIGFIIFFAAAYVGTGYWIYETVEMKAAMAAFMTNLFAMMVTIVGPITFGGFPGLLFGMITLTLQIILTAYFVCPAATRVYDR